MLTTILKNNLNYAYLNRPHIKVNKQIIIQKVIKKSIEKINIKIMENKIKIKY